MPEPRFTKPPESPVIPPRGTRHWLLFLGRVAATVFLLALVLRHMSWAEVTARLETLAPAKLLLAMLILAAVTPVVGLRWRVIAGTIGCPIGFVQAWIVSMIGTAFDQGLFTMSGDGYRIWWLNKGWPSLARAVCAVVLDRVAGALGIVLLVIAFLPRLATLDPSRELFWIPLGLVAAGLLGFSALLLLDRVAPAISETRWVRGVGALSKAARRVFLSPGSAVPALAAAVTIHVLISACIATLAWAIGIELGLGVALAVVPPVMLISLLPISIGGWGVREGAMVLSLGLVGIDISDAVLISVMYGLGAAAIGVSGGILWLLGMPRAGLPPAAAASR